jgi:hypothetical protein
MCPKQRCNRAATAVATFAKTLQAVQFKKSMPGIPRREQNFTKLYFQKKIVIGP